MGSVRSRGDYLSGLRPSSSFFRLDVRSVVSSAFNMVNITRQCVIALGAVSAVQALDKSLRIGSGGRTIHHFLREIESNPFELARRDLEARDINPEKLYPKQYFDIPVDHFPDNPKYAPHTNRTFKNRYWFDDSHYKPGGPVIILQSGETNALSRLPYMQNGILALLAEATNGMAVVLEHRYYGYSFPTRYLTTKDLRFLTTEQALADEVYFAQNIVFPGHEDKNLTSYTTPYISYGGSYPGAFSAFLRVKYPDVFWGSIASSGVTKAIYNYWEYFAPIAEYGPAFAMKTHRMFTQMIDNILIGKSDNQTLRTELKTAFGLPNVTHDADFANQLASGLSWWQELNWCVFLPRSSPADKLTRKLGILRSAIQNSTGTQAISRAPMSCTQQRSRSAQRLLSCWRLRASPPTRLW